MKKNQYFNLGLKEMEAGNIAEGRRWLMYALRDNQLDNKRRAIAWTWLAEAEADRAQKREYFEAALEADPENDFAQDKLQELLRPPHPQPEQQPAPPPTLPEAPQNPLVPAPPPAPIYVPSNPPPPPQSTPFIQEPPPIEANGPEMQRSPTGTLRPQHRPRSDHHIVGIQGGPNGNGSGFFLTTSGIIVTTRYVVGANEKVTIELEPGNQMEARVVRSFPAIDVALLYSGHGVQELLPNTMFDTIPENAAVFVMPYQSRRVDGRRRETGRILAEHLFPTDIVQLPDAGGGPVFNHQRQEVVGMITRNVSSSSAYVYGVNYSAIKRCLDRYNYELQQVAERVYCASCGYASAAGTVGGFYCEVCGTVMPHAAGQTRVHHQRMAAIYGDSTARPCINCRATVGYHKGFCLRCGQAGEPDQPPGVIR